MSKIGEWLENRLYNNRYNLPDIKELDEIICRYYKCGVAHTYKDMTPDEVWEHFYDFLGIPYNNVNDAEEAFDDMCDKMGRSTYAHEFIKNEIKK